MSGLDAAEISSAYAAVRSNKDATNWLLISYAAAAGNRLTLSQTGTGGVAELAAALDDAQVQYGYVRVEYVNDAESRRVKFALVVCIGERTKVMRKARVSVESGDVKCALPHHSIAVTTGDISELNEKELITRLRKAGGGRLQRRSRLKTTDKPDSQAVRQSASLHTQPSRTTAPLDQCPRTSAAPGSARS